MKERYFLQLFIFQLTYCITIGITSDYDVIPTSLTVAPNSTAIFRCQHHTAIGIGWHVNGTAFIPSNPDITPNTDRDRGGRLVYTLSIVARLIYNYTQIQCVAFFIDMAPELSPVATLIILEGFFEVPASLNVTAMDKAIFRCRHSNEGMLSWTVNTISLSAFDPSMTYSTIHSISDGSELSLQALPRFNQSYIRCTVINASDVIEETPPAILYIQGNLESVSNLNVSVMAGEIHYSWESPFSLDLTNINPDIVYCVTVYNITCGKKDLVVSGYNISQPRFNLDVDIAYLYDFTIIPRSNVELSVDGVPLQAQVYFVNLTIKSKELCINSTEVYVRMAFNMEGSFDERVVPKSFSLYLSPIDSIGEPHLYPADFEIRRDAMTLIVTTLLPQRRLWVNTVIAYNCIEHSLSEAFELSTHDIQNISVMSQNSGEITVTGDFLTNSTAAGVLLVVYDNDSYINYQETRRSPMQLRISATFKGLNSSLYKLSTFVIQENEQPFENTATIPKSIYVNSTVSTKSALTWYTLRPTSTGVCITCNLKNSSATYCVVVVHQRISYLNCSGLIKLESSRIILRSGDSASGCIEGVNLEEFQVGAYLSTVKANNMVSTNSVVLVVVSGILGSVFFSTTIVVVLTCITVIIKRKRVIQCRVSSLDLHQDQQMNYMESINILAISNSTPQDLAISENCATKSQTLMTIDNLLKFLRPIASNWRALGLVLSLQDDLLNKISSENETDEARLTEVLQKYKESCSSEHDWNWKGMVNKLTKMKEYEVADTINRLVLSNGELEEPEVTNEVMNQQYDISNGELEEPEVTNEVMNQQCDISNGELEELEITSEVMNQQCDITTELNMNTLTLCDPGMASLEECTPQLESTDGYHGSSTFDLPRPSSEWTEKGYLHDEQKCVNFNEDYQCERETESQLPIQAVDQTTPSAAIPLLIAPNTLILSSPTTDGHLRRYLESTNRVIALPSTEQSNSLGLSFHGISMSETML